MLNLENVMRIPEEYVSETPCQTNPNLFTDPALDVDQDDEGWNSLSKSQQEDLLESKEAAENRAKASCKRCPLAVFTLCEKSDQEAEIKAFGVIAGKTFEERTNPSSVLSDDKIVRNANGQIADETILAWTAKGLSNNMIAKRMGVTPRTVERRKAAIIASQGSSNRYSGPARSASNPTASHLSNTKTAKRAAGRPLQPARVTQESAALYDALVDGSFKDRSNIIDTLIDYVDRQTAFDRAPKDREYANDEARIRIGARKFLMNRIDIAVRSGRILEAKSSTGQKMIALEPGTIQVWSAWRSQN